MADAGVNRDWAFRELKYSLQALAVPAADQIRAQTPACVVQDELLLDYDHSYEVLSQHFGSELTGEQRTALRRVHEHSDQWTEQDNAGDPLEDLARRPFWVTMRSFAAEALARMRWPVEPPPPYKPLGDGVWQRQ